MITLGVGGNVISISIDVLVEDAFKKTKENVKGLFRTQYTVIKLILLWDGFAYLHIYTLTLRQSWHMSRVLINCLGHLQHDSDWTQLVNDYGHWFGFHASNSFVWLDTGWVGTRKSLNEQLQHVAWKLAEVTG